jgi:hypothetical protein
MRTVSTPPASSDPVSSWLDALYTELGLNGVDRRRCVDDGRIVVDGIPMVCCVPVMPGCDVVFQALAGEVGPAETSGPIFEAALQMQTLLCGPAMPMFGFDVVSRQLTLMNHFAIHIDAPDFGAIVLRTLSAMARQWREVLEKQTAGTSGRSA